MTHNPTPHLATRAPRQAQALRRTWQHIVVLLVSSGVLFCLAGPAAAAQQPKKGGTQSGYRGDSCSLCPATPMACGF